MWATMDQLLANPAYDFLDPLCFIALVCMYGLKAIWCTEDYYNDEEDE